MDPSGRSLTLRAGTGNVGQELLKRGHHLPISSSSLNGQAVIEIKAVIVEDTTTSPIFLPNPLLPNTHSEMAIPLIADGQVIGVLDMQSETPGALNQGNLPAFEALAGQVAIAIQNAALFAETRQARAEVEDQVRRLTQEGWQGFMDAGQRQERIGFAFDQSTTVPIEKEELSAAPTEGSLSTPIRVGGAEIGTVQVAGEDGQHWTGEDVELVKAATAQLAQHIENLRLLAQAEQYRGEAEQALRRLTREGWDEYIQSGQMPAAGFVYDLNEVRTLSESTDGHEAAAVKQPLVINQETIGELAVSAPTDEPGAADEIISAVAAQLSAQLENLRLSTSNVSLLKATEERARREQTLREITSAMRSSTNPATIMQTAVRELANVLGRRTTVRMTTAENTEAAADNKNASDSPGSSSATSAAGGKE
jgi:GAF domain-containing protein